VQSEDGSEGRNIPSIRGCRRAPATIGLLLCQEPGQGRLAIFLGGIKSENLSSVINRGADATTLFS
jgi:hypothetical protein